MCAGVALTRVEGKVDPKAVCCNEKNKTVPNAHKKKRRALQVELRTVHRHLHGLPREGAPLRLKLPCERDDENRCADLRVGSFHDCALRKVGGEEEVRGRGGIR